MPKGERTFRANIAALYDELMAAHQWSRPSIITAICNDHWVKKKAMTSLGEKLKKSDGLSVVDFNFYNKTPDIIPHFKALSEHKNSIVFSYNLDQPGSEDEGIAYRALNMQREYFVEEGIKLVLWLNPHEASLLPGRAPDFWAFRHLVVTFSDAKKIENPKIGSRLMIWHDGEMYTHPSELNSKVRINLQSLSELPNTHQAMSSRINLHQKLAHLYWNLGEHDKSLEFVETGLRTTEKAEFSKEHIFFLNALAIIRQTSGNYPEAAHIFEAVNRQVDGDPILMMNHAISLLCNGKRRLGMTLAKRAVDLDMQNPTLVSRLAYLSLLTGRISDAIDRFEDALKLDPRIEFNIAQAICKLQLNRLNWDDFNTQRASQNDFITDACLWFLKGERETAINTLLTAVNQLHISWDAVLINPNIWLLINSNDLAVNNGMCE